MLRQATRVLAPALAILTLAGCATSGQQAGANTSIEPTAYTGRLSGDEIRKHLIGRKLGWVTCRGKCRGTLRHAPGGASTITGRSLNGPVNSPGQWRISGSRLCVSWQNASPGKGGCSSFSWRDKNTVVTNEGVVLSI